MKKLLNLVLILALAAALCACSAPTAGGSIDNAPQTTPTPVPSVNLADREVALYGAVPGEILLEELMADFATKIQAGSAGSSLKAVAQACRLMDWGMDTAMTEEEIFAAVDFFLSGLDDEALSVYMMQLSLLDSTYQQLLLPGQESLLETAGCADSRYPWTDMPIRCVETFFTATGLRQTYQLPTSYEPEPADIYAPLAREYYLAFLDGWDYEYTEEKGLNSTLIMESAPYEPLSFLGYTSHDINGDGVPEFILGDMNDEAARIEQYRAQISSLDGESSGNTEQQDALQKRLDAFHVHQTEMFLKLCKAHLQAAGTRSSIEQCIQRAHHARIGFSKYHGRGLRAAIVRIIHGFHFADETVIEYQFIVLAVDRQAADRRGHVFDRGGFALAHIKKIGAQMICAPPFRASAQIKQSGYLHRCLLRRCHLQEQRRQQVRRLW